MTKIYNLADLKPDRSNANKGTQRGRGMVESSLRETGAGRSILVDRDGNVIAGNKTLEAWSDIATDEDVIIVQTDGKKLVVVQRNDLDLSDDTGTARKLAIYDNRASEVGLDWDTTELFASMQNGMDLATFWNEDELKELFTDLEPEQAEPSDAEPQIDRASELQEIWQVKTGDIWKIGAHRLACGDCTDADTVARLMDGEKIDCIVTDPPYGVDYDGGTTVREKLSGDGSADLYLPALSTWKSYCNHHVALYLWYADGDQVIAQAVAQAVAQAGWQVRRNLIWNKNQAQYGALSQQYKQKHEPFLYCHIKGKSPYWGGDGTEVTVWDVNRHSVNEFHPTQKPPALFERAINNSSRKNNIVFDGFAGSGTTFVACHNLSRRCRAIELLPTYCSVILQRMTDAFPSLIIERL